MLPDGWKNGKLGDLCTFKGGFGFKEIHQGHEKGDLPFIKVSDMNRAGNEVHINSSNNWISHDQKREMRVKTFPPHSIVFAKVGAALLLNRRRILSRDTIIDNNMMAAVSKTTCYYNYLFYILSAIDFGKFVQEGAVPSINQGDLSSFKISYPPLHEQKKIAAILSTWDRAIEGTEKLLANSQQQKKALMQQLLTGKKRLPGFTGEWKRQSFKVIFDVDNQKDTQTPASEYKEEGHIPIVDQGKSFISGYTDTNTVYENVPVIIFGDHTRVIKWVDFPFSPGADGTQVLRTRANTLNKFGYYLLQNTDLPNLGYSRHMKELKEQIFHLPPLPEQKAIAAVLTTADEEITALESDLSRLRQEKKSLMQQLLTGKRRVTVD